MTPDARHSAYLEAVGRDLDVAARRYARVRRRRRVQMRVAALSVTAVILLTGSALAGSSLLGMPAPGIVQATLDSLWPRDDTSDLAPVAGAARLVAQSDHAALYRSPAKRRGAVCLSIVPGTGGPACINRLPDRNWPFGVVSRVEGDRQLVYGQIRHPAAVSLVAQWRGGDAIQIPIGVDGFFVGEVPLARTAAGATPEMATLRIMDGDGFVIASRDFTRFSG